MASSLKLTPFLLLSFLFIQIHARESNFFSKVPNSVDNKLDTQIPNKIDPLSKEQTQHEQDQPNFIPQTQDNGYGLYGHESGQLPPSATKFSDPTTTTTYNTYKSDSPYKTESEEFYNNDNSFENSNPNSKPYANSFYYNKNLYENRPQNFETARFSRDDYSATPLYNQQNNKNSFYFNGGDNVNAQRQGMSDTRFMENGKYYYDLNREPRHHRSSSWNNNGRGYFGNSYENSNSNSNSMEGYQNQNDEAEFQEEPEEFMP